MNTYSSVTAERSRSYRIVGVAAVLMAAVAVGVMFVAGVSSRPRLTGGLPVGAVSSPSASPKSSLSPSPAIQAAFLCGESSLTAKQPPLTAFVDAIRAGSHAGYDRLTIEFQNGQPGSVTIRPQAGTTFTRSPSGRAVKLAGANGILLVLRGADAHTSYTGPRDINTGDAGLVEVRVLEDFEGQLSLGLGVSHTACYRASLLTSPARLVIDITVG